jgi:hypothetical protein
MPLFNTLNEQEKRMFMVNAFVVQLLPTFVTRGIIDVEKAAEWTTAVRDTQDAEALDGLFTLPNQPTT